MVGKVLTDPFNRTFADLSGESVTHVNGVAPVSLRHLSAMLDEACRARRDVEIRCFSNRVCLLRPEDALAADKRICVRYQVARTRSRDLDHPDAK